MKLDMNGNEKTFFTYKKDLCSIPWRYRLQKDGFNILFLFYFCRYFKLTILFEQRSIS
jgi:hypothetical protein